MKKFLILFVPLLLTGCWNYRELNQMAIVSAIAVEKEGDLFNMSAQIMNAKKTDTQNSAISGGGASPVTVLKAKGKTMHEALRNMVLFSPRKLYIGHTDLFIIDEAVAYEGIMDIIDFMIRDPESRKQLQVVISRDEKASDILKILTPLQTLPTQDIIATLDVASEHKGVITEITYDELLSYIYEDGIEPTVPALTVYGDLQGAETAKNAENSVPKANIKLTGMSVFKNEKLLGFLGKNDSLGFNIIRNNITYDVIPYKCDSENYASLEIVRFSTKFVVDIKNNKPVVHIKTTGTGYLSEMNCDVNVDSAKGRKNITNAVNNTVKDLIEHSIDTVQSQYDSDIFGFGNYLYKNNYSYWEKNKGNWDKLFANLKYDVKVDLKLRKKGSIINSAKEG